MDDWPKKKCKPLALLGIGPADEEKIVKKRGKNYRQPS